jgi:hypothetical protein
MERDMLRRRIRALFEVGVALLTTSVVPYLWKAADPSDALRGVGAILATVGAAAVLMAARLVSRYEDESGGARGTAQKQGSARHARTARI